jgi:hypothetical protein
MDLVTDYVVSVLVSFHLSIPVVYDGSNGILPAPRRLYLHFCPISG